MLDKLINSHVGISIISKKKFSAKIQMKSSKKAFCHIHDVFSRAMSSSIKIIIFSSTIKEFPLKSDVLAPQSVKTIITMSIVNCCCFYSTQKTSYLIREKLR
jgi:hypothetical protein